MKSISFKIRENALVLDIYVDGVRTYAVWGKEIHHAYNVCSKSGPALKITNAVCPCGHEIPSNIHFLLKLRALEFQDRK